MEHFCSVQEQTTSIFHKGLEEKFGAGYNLSALSDKDIVEAVQQYKIAHNNALFKSSPKWWPGLLKRADSEKEDLIKLADHEAVLAKNGIIIPFDVMGPTQQSFKGIPYTFPETRALQLGTRGLDVARLQNNLEQLGITTADGSTVIANGNFDIRTQEAVQAFQRQYGLTATGLADKETLAAMQVGVRAIESVQAALQFGQEFQPHAKNYRADWLDRDAHGIPNYSRASNLPGPSPVEHAATERSSAYHPSMAPASPSDRSGPTRAPQHPHMPPPILSSLSATQTLEPGDRSAAVLALQQHLRLLGASDRYGQPIQADRDYGDRTREAVEQFQLWTGREPTGVADPGTLQALQSQAQFALRQQAQGIVIAPDAHLADRLQPAKSSPSSAAFERPVFGRDLPLSDAGHASPAHQAAPSMLGPGHRILSGRQQDHLPEPSTYHSHEARPFPTGHRDHALFESIRRQLPPGTSDEMAAHIMLEAKIGGVEHVGKLDEVIVQDGWAYVAGKTPGDMAAVELSASVPALRETLQRSAAFDQQQAIQMAQFQEQQRAINMPGGGPTMQPPGGGFGMG